MNDNEQTILHDPEALRAQFDAIESMADLIALRKAIQEHGRAMADETITAHQAEVMTALYVSGRLDKKRLTGLLGRDITDDLAALSDLGFVEVDHAVEAQS